MKLVVNDGIQPFYSATDLEGYKNSKGVNDLRYPNVDYYKEFLRDASTFRKATIELNGGTEESDLCRDSRLYGSSGLEKVSDRSNLNRINARGNLDLRIYRLSDCLADVAGRIEKKDWGAVDGATLFSEISTLRPNEYPFMIAPEDINGRDGVTTDESSLIFGTSVRKTNKPVYGYGLWR